MIAEQIVAVLSDSPDQEMFLAALGNRTSKLLKLPLRDAIGDTKLADFIKDNLGKRIALSGSKDRLLAKLVSSDSPQATLPITAQGVPISRSGDIRSVSRKYARNFWDAFLRPARRHHRRAIQSKAPFNWSDFPQDRCLRDGSRLNPHIWQRIRVKIGRLESGQLERQ
jgi:hypothetical protein